MSRISERVNILFCLGVALLILLPVGRAEGAGDNEPNLLELALKKFGTLNEAEEELFRSVADGEVADCNDKSGKNNDPNEAKDRDPNTGVLKWDLNTRVIRADRIAWLCTDRGASELATHRGVQVQGARIDGELDLSDARIPFPLYFEKSAFTGGINLLYAEIQNLMLIGTHTGPIYGDGLKVEGSVFLRNGFKAEGEVNLVGARIGGDLDCSGGQFIDPNGTALSAGGANMKGYVYLRDGFKAEGEVDLTGATIGRDLDCSKGEFIDPNGYALSAGGADIKGSVILSNNFKAEGEVRLVGATIGGILDCSKGEFIDPNGYALNANGANIGQNVFLSNGFKATGEVDLTGATIGRDLDCSKGEFIDPNGYALNANGANIGQNVFLSNGFKATGEVNLISAIIGGNLVCDGGQFIDANGYALSANGANIKGNVYLRDDFEAKGKVDLDAATIDGYFQWWDVNSPEEVTLDLISAKVGILLDDANSWPEKDHLFLNNFEYKEIDDLSPRTAEERIKWLRLQKGFSPQPYEQLAEVFRKSGKDEDAREILIAKNVDKADRTKLTFAEKCWYHVFGRMIGYGYRPWRALWGVLVFVVLGWILFGFGYLGGLVTPQSDSAYAEGDTGITIPGDDDRKLSEVYPRFNFLMYSVDTFVPLIDLHQAKYWLPNANRGHELFNIKGWHTGGLLRLYLWIHLAMGWALSTLLVVGLTGLVRT